MKKIIRKFICFTFYTCQSTVPISPSAPVFLSPYYWFTSVQRCIFTQSEASPVFFLPQHSVVEFYIRTGYILPPTCTLQFRQTVRLYLHFKISHFLPLLRKSINFDSVNHSHVQAVELYWKHFFVELKLI